MFQISDVIHWGAPRSLNGFMQESGRAGRDGNAAFSIVYYHNMNISASATNIDDVQQRNLQSGEQVPVRNIWIRERSVEGKITLRRNHTQLPLTVGSYTEEAPAEIEMLTVEGFTLQEEDVLLVCTDESGDIKDYLCARYLVEALFILDEEEDITISMSNILPASVRVEIVPGTSEGSRINNISLV
ncbi:Hypothetical predicted protein [Mytilus galloprovincialis]|uniref:Helicase C-terminal domain-containing protein n=1 Tax=Mytilus galloprovincialis TaxID=29158 RepID=A0A8B6HBW0_MYTGA|nr:Hypothetical predicted protein [Mytilus galloprovincialis]